MVAPDTHVTYTKLPSLRNDSLMTFIFANFRVARPNRAVQRDFKKQASSQHESWRRCEKLGPFCWGVHLQPHSRYQRFDLDLHAEEEFNFVDLILGGNKEIETIDGNVVVKVAGGTKLGVTLKLAGKGMMYKGRKGDLYIRVSSKIPSEISDEEREILENLRKKENFKQ